MIHQNLFTVDSCEEFPSNSYFISSYVQNTLRFGVKHEEIFITHIGAVKFQDIVQFPCTVSHLGYCLN